MKIFPKIKCDVFMTPYMFVAFFFLSLSLSVDLRTIKMPKYTDSDGKSLTIQHTYVYYIQIYI